MTDVVGLGSRLAAVGSLLTPKSVVVLGASARKYGHGNQVLANLLDSGFGGATYVVHPTAPQIQGIAAVASADELPTTPDVAVIALPAAGVVDALADLERIGTKAAIVPSVGLSATDQQRLRSVVARSPMVVQGPNCMGNWNLTNNVPLWIMEGHLVSEPPGTAALVAQSGTAPLGILHSCGYAHFSKIVSSGNELGLTMADFVSYFATDDATEVVGLVIESIRDVDAFVASLAALGQAGKRAVAMKVGRSDAGSRATIAHTGAAIGRDEAYQALFEDLELPLVRDYDEMASALDCLVWRPLPRAVGSRVAVVTLSGGQAALAADICEREGLALAPLTDVTRQSLGELLPGAEPDNPFDAAASVRCDPDGFQLAVQALARDPAVDAVVVVLDGQVTSSRAEIEWSRAYFEATAAAAQRVPDKPIICASSSSVSVHPDALDAIGRMPILRGIRNAAVSVRCLAARVPPASPSLTSQLLTTTPDALRRAVDTHAGTVPRALGQRMLEHYGLQPVVSVSVANVDEAIAAAETIGFPVVVKIDSPQVPHRTELGAVIKDVATSDALRSAIARIENAVTARGLETSRFEVQRQLEGCLEVALGFVSDPVFGPTLLIGPGGVFVELLGEKQFAKAPITAEKALAMIERTAIGRLADGYRRIYARTPLDALAAAVARFSALAWEFRHEIVEADLNPILVEQRTGAPTVVDWLFVG